MKPSRRKEPPAFSRRDAFWLATVVAGLAVASLVVGWVATRAGAVAPVEAAVPVDPGPVAPVDAAEAVPVWPVKIQRPEEPEQRIIPRYEAVRMTVQSLRDHARQDPGAADVLTDAQIRELEAEGGLIK